jgi:hypothetical protein
MEVMIPVRSVISAWVAQFLITVVVVVVVLAVVIIIFL